MSYRGNMRRGSGNVFLDLGFPESEADILALRSELIIRIEKVVRRSGLTQAAMARCVGIAHAKLNALLCGKLSQFNLDDLVTIATSMGLRVALEIACGGQPYLLPARAIRRARRTFA